MKIQKRRKWTMAATVCLFALSAATIAFAENVKGADCVTMEERTKLEGKLIQEGDEWSIMSGANRYALHLGPEEYRRDKGLVLENGRNAVLEGFMHGKDIAVTEISTGGTTLALRGEDGRPAWAGTGYGKRMRVNAKDGCLSRDTRQMGRSSCDVSKESRRCERQSCRGGR